MPVISDGGSRLHPEFGKVPGYLSKVKSDIVEEKRLVAACVDAERNEQPAAEAVLMAAGMRQDLLRQLKLTWQKTNQIYQRGSHQTKLDTISKVKNKEKMENKLRELELAIKKLQQKGDIDIVG